MKTPSEHSLKHQICERLKKARLARGFHTAKAFALANDLKVSTYSLHEAGTRAMSFDVIEDYCKLLNVRPSWLLTGHGSIDAFQQEIPIIEWEEILDFPTQVDVTQKAWTVSDLSLNAASFAVKIKDDTMAPRYPEGTLLLVDVGQMPQDREFALFVIDNHHVCFKQLVSINNEWYIRTLNPVHPAEKITNSIKALGKVVQAKLYC